MKTQTERLTNGMRWLGRASLIAIGLAVYAGQAPIFAQPEPEARSTDVRGTVQSFTTAPRGETDGATLDNGTSLHWPPHLQDRFTNAIKVGDLVRATGRTHTGPAGDAHFEVQSVTNLRTNATVDNPDFNDGPPRPGRRAHDRGPRMRGPLGGPHPGPAPDNRNQSPPVEVHGTVQRMTTAPKGEVDGAVLDSVTRLHWPPHMQDRFASIVKPGDEVRASGRTITGPAGDTHFEVANVTNIKTNAKAENPDFEAGPAAVAGGPHPPEALDAPQVEARLRDLQSQIDALRREIDRLRR